MSFLIYPTIKQAPILGMLGMGGGIARSRVTEDAGNFSVFFNGTTSKSFIRGANNSCWAAGTGDFSVEVFLKADQYNHYLNFVNTRAAAGTTAGWTFSVESDGTLGFYTNNHTYSTAGSVVDDVWTHVVTTRQSGKLRLFQDGVLRSSADNTQNFSNQMFVIGINASGVDSSTAAGWYRGYMSNLRYIVGSVPTDYQTSSTTNGTTIFTTPTSSLTTTSQGATASDVQFLGLKDETSATATDVAGATISKGNHGSDVTVGHAGPF